ncbi:hypothetical protein SKAU_G00428340 [Synaphobranchus kaupii]|uniref:Uncharacterized protein n=1 Tax=Synaphobranchus kaupii TaxID=118154 RepID=A0A9Q1E4R2_SYNKA|nr:hypothetical protein SKAU_G00428340 [Synaphobranchus kaupii]
MFRSQTGTGLDRNWTGRSTPESGSGTVLFQTGTGLGWNWTGRSTLEHGSGTDLSQTGTGLDWNWTGRSTLELGSGTDLFQTGTGLDWNWTGQELDREVHTGTRGLERIRSKPELDWTGTGPGGPHWNNGLERICSKPELDWTGRCETHTWTGIAGERLTTAGQELDRIDCTGTEQKQKENNEHEHRVTNVNELAPTGSQPKD